MVFKGRLNRNNHQKPTFHPLGDFLNPALALLGQGLKKSPIGQKLDFANHPYLCKGLYWFFCDFCFDLQNLMYYYQGLGIYKTTTENES
ncbi:hypothetical protein BSPWISOXPB_2740 [uncultured Gammaproteobacteria bacterium]|nr:hypothetical protein BSPWISOXPB_2740 [uncultured Gammaproteobacteria bacterium]